MEIVTVAPMMATNVLGLITEELLSISHVNATCNYGMPMMSCKLPAILENNIREHVLRIMLCDSCVFSYEKESSSFPRSNTVYKNKR